MLFYNQWSLINECVLSYRSAELDHAEIESGPGSLWMNVIQNAIDLSSVRPFVDPAQVALPRLELRDIYNIKINIGNKILETMNQI